MEAILRQLNELPEAERRMIEALFGSVSKLYAVCYLVARTDHELTSQKAPLWEQKVATVHYIKNKIITFLDRLAIDGQNLWDDIASDYFEDFVAYRERNFSLTNDEYIAIIKNMQNLP